MIVRRAIVLFLSLTVSTPLLAKAEPLKEKQQETKSYSSWVLPSLVSTFVGGISYWAWRFNKPAKDNSSQGERRASQSSQSSQSSQNLHPSKDAFFQSAFFPQGNPDFSNQQVVMMIPNGALAVFSGQGEELSLSPEDVPMEAIQLLLTQQAQQEAQQEVESNYQASGLSQSNSVNTVTHPARFPHLVDHVLSLRAGATQESQQVLLLGPGLVNNDHAGVSIPQLHEVATLFPEASLTVIDFEQSVLDAITQSHYRRDQALEILNFNGNLAGIPVSRHQILREFYNSVGEQLPLSRIQSRLGDFETMTVSSELYDVVIGTFSLAYVLAEKDRETKIKILKKFLLSLKAGGRLYIERLGVGFIYPTVRELNLFDGDQYIITLDGVRFTGRLIAQPSAYMYADSSNRPCLRYANSCAVNTDAVLEFTRE